MGRTYKIIPQNKNEQWGVEFENLTHPHLIVGGTDYGKVPATDVTFEYLGPDKIKNNTKVPLLLAEFKSSRRTIPSSLALPSGSTIFITYDYKTKDSSGSKIPFGFTVAPGPSSFVIATLVGSCATGVVLLTKAPRDLTNRGWYFAEHFEASPAPPDRFDSARFTFARIQAGFRLSLSIPFQP